MWQCHDIARWLDFTCNTVLSLGDLSRKGVGEVKGTGNQTEKTWEGGGKHWIFLLNRGHK